MTAAPGTLPAEEGDREQHPERLRLAVATARYPPLTGGIELHVEEVCRRLAAWGVDVTLLTTDLTGRLPETERRNGVEITRFPAWPSRRDYYFSPGIYNRIVGGDWDLLHVQGFQTLVAPTAMLAAIRAGLPYVVTFHTGGHSSRIRKALVPVQDRVLQPLLARADRLIALTATQAESRAEQLQLPDERFVVIPNGSDLPSPSNTNIEREPGLLASIGRLERYKGHQRVIAAMPFVASRRPDARLWIAGGGPYEADLRRLIDDLDISDRVEIREIPVRDRARMAEELARVHVVVSMSEFESHGIAVLEALGAGCRGVVARAPGLADLIEGRLARGVPLESSPAELAAVLLEELDRAPAAAPRRLPTWEDCARALWALYEDVVRRRHRNPTSHDH